MELIENGKLTGAGQSLADGLLQNSCNKKLCQFCPARDLQTGEPGGVGCPAQGYSGVDAGTVLQLIDLRTASRPTYAALLTGLPE